MTDHLEQAAARAIELAQQVAAGADTTLETETAAHLTYLAGLIRGGAVKEPNVNTYSPAQSGERRSSAPDEPVRFYPASGVSYDKVRADKATPQWLHNLLDAEELHQLRAERGRAGEEIMRMQRELNEARRQAEDLHGRRTAAAEGFRKLWHEAATQRDMLYNAAEVVLVDGNLDTEYPELDARLREAFERVQGSALTARPSTGDRLRRELWHVLDRMPASDDNLIATVKKLLEDLEAATELYRVERDARIARERQRDELRQVARLVQQSRRDISVANTAYSAEHRSTTVEPELLDRLAELAKEQQ